MKIKYSPDCVISKEYDGSEITLSDYQKALKEMLKDVILVFETLKIPYFIEGGTLLGAVRHRDMIPWDDDIDLCFFIEDYDRLLAGLQAQLKDIYAVQCFDTDPNYNVTQPLIKIRKKNTYVHTYDAVYERNNCTEKGIFIDLIVITKISESPWENLWYRKRALLRTLFLLGFNKLGINVTWLKRRHLKQAEKFHRRAINSHEYGYGLNMIAWQNMHIHESDLLPFCRLRFGDMELPAPADYDRYLRNCYGDYMQIPNLDTVELYHSRDVKLKSGYRGDHS